MNVRWPASALESPPNIARAERASAKLDHRRVLAQNTLDRAVSYESTSTPTSRMREVECTNFCRYSAGSQIEMMCLPPPRSSGVLPISFNNVARYVVLPDPVGP